MMLLGLNAAATTLGPRGRNVRLRGLDPGVQSGLTIIGALAFGAFVLTVLGISKSAEKKR